MLPRFPMPKASRAKTTKSGAVIRNVKPNKRAKAAMAAGDWSTTDQGECRNAHQETGNGRPPPASVAPGAGGDDARETNQTHQRQQMAGEQGIDAAILGEGHQVGRDEEVVEPAQGIRRRARARTVAYGRRPAGRVIPPRSGFLAGGAASAAPVAGRQRRGPEGQQRQMPQGRPRRRWRRQPECARITAKSANDHQLSGAHALRSQCRWRNRPYPGKARLTISDTGVIEAIPFPNAKMTPKIRENLPWLRTARTGAPCPPR